MSLFWSVIQQAIPLALQHIALSVPAIVIGFVLAVPLGWLANRYRVTRGVLLSIVSILYAVPSFALLFVIPVLIGTRILDPLNLVVILSVYAVAIMVRTAADAFAAVPGDVLQSATAVGFSSWRRFWAVELPLAGEVLISGLRVVSVSTVSLTTVGALIGNGGLGQLFTDGYQRLFIEEVVVGIVGTVVIAVVFDLVIVLVGRFAMPWRRTERHKPSGAQAEAALA